MISLLGKATLYDMLACAIPGYLLLLLFKLCFASSTAIKFDNISVAIAAFTLSYLVGLLIKRGMEVVFYGFLRNSSDRIRRAYNKSKCIFRKLFRKNLWYIPFFVLSLQRSPGKALSPMIRCW